MRLWPEYFWDRVLGYTIVILVFGGPFVVIAVATTLGTFALCGNDAWPTAIFLSLLAMFCWYRFLHYVSDKDELD